MRRLTLRLLHVVFTALCLTTAALSATTSISSADLPLEARNIDSSSQEDDLISTSYVLPNQIFNDGKPYYASKDPISGQLDFNSKKPAGIEPEVNEVIDPKEKIVFSNSSPNIHDFLNLPVKYSSSKFVYPLVSSSYANLKYQGNNKNYMTNKKPTSVIAPPVTPTPGSPSYANNYYTVPTTKLMAVPPTASGVYTTSTSTSTTPKKPTTTSASSSSSTSTTTSTTSTSTTTTAQPSSTIKYTTSTRKPLPITTTTYAPRTTTTRKKFMPTKKYSPTVPVTTATTSMRFPTEQTRPTTPTGTKATRQPVPQTPFPTTTTTATKPSSSSSQPIVFTESPSVPPTPISTRIPDLDAADVYQTLGQKNTEQKFEQKPSMSLADIFNSLAEEESALAFQNQGNSGFDAEGNIMQPIAPSRPSPFAIQHAGRPQSTLRPTFGTTPLPQSTAQRIPTSDQKVLAGSQENYSNEYVSYQVQQPNVMQYRPVPGAINNVVISPGQNSATFVLGSQQQVGTNTFGSVEKAPLFSKDPSVQYGTVISEDISSLKRPVSNGPQSTGFPAAASPPTGSYQQTPSNFHQNGIPVGPSGQYGQRPSGIGSSFTETPPEPPSPYQQLPLVGTIKRPLMQQTEQQSPQVPYQGIAQSEGQLMQQSQVPTLPHGSAMNMNQIRPQIQHQEGKLQAASEETQELLVSTNIRFPASDQSDEVSAGPFAAGPPAGPQVNGHAQPLSLQQIQQSNPVVFPKTSENEQNIAENTGNSKNPTLNEVQFQNGNAVGQNIQIQQHEVLTMKQHKQKLNFPKGLSEQQQQKQQQQQHIPSQHMEPPPRFPTTVEPQEMHRRPPQNRPHGGSVPPSFKYNDHTRKPIPGISRPISDRHLPNILPQFRPNAKISSGHPPAYNQEPGNIRITSNQPLNRPMNPSPQFSHRRQPVPQQRYPMKRISDYPAGPPPPPSSAYADANRRIYRTSPYGNSHPQFVDRLYARRPPMVQSHITPAADSYAVERHAFAVDGPMPQMSPNTLEKMAAFEEEDLVINDPPQPVTPSKERKAEEEDKLEPVVTLQMLQSQKKPASVTAASSDDSSSGEIQVPDVDTHAESAPAFEKVDPQNGLYVVYPMAADAAGLKEESKDTQPAAAHIEGAPTPTGSEYQNTPFSVMRDQPQEPILMVKPHKKPQSLQQKTKPNQTQQGPKDKFPYPIEKPDPSYTELNAQKRVPGVLIAPRIMNGPYATGTEAPIAIAYTPTEPNDYRRNGLYNHNQQHHDTPQNPQNSANRYSNINLASAVISEIRPSDTQTEEGLNNDFDVRGQNYEKNFMAPFYPSVSLGDTATAHTPSNGWNILPSSTDSSVYEKNNINRADVGEPNDEDADAAESTTKSFELDSFQPELQGGFKPIYPPGYKTYDEQDEHALHLHEDGKQAPVALASHMEPSKGILPHTLPTVVSHITTTSSTTTTTTHKPLLGSTPSTSTTSTTKAPQKSANNSNTTVSDISVVSTTTNPTATPKLKKKPSFETSLAALLFGEDEDFEDGEARKEKSTIKAISGPRSNVPRSGPRNLKLS